MVLTLFIFMLVQGLVSSEEEMETEGLSCFDIVIGNSEEVNSSGSLPDAEELLLRCPVMKEFVDCQIRRALPIYQETFLSIRRFVDDLCDEESQLHNAYVNNVDCIRPIENEKSVCEEIASDVLHEYVKSGYAFQSIELAEGLDEEQLENKKDYHVYAESHCLLIMFPFTCIGKKILETCGSGAYDTYIEIITRTRLPFGYCDENILKYFIKGYTEFLSNENKSSEIHIFYDVLNVKTD